MSGLFSFLQQLFIVYGMIIIGYLIKKSKALPEEMDQVFTQMVLKISLPALIISSMNFSFEKNYLIDFGYLLFISLYTLGISSILAYTFSNKLRFSQERSGVSQGLIIFGNQGFLGYAMCYGLFAQKGVMYASIYNIPFLLLIWTYGVYLISKDQRSFSWIDVLANPGIIATLLGILLLPFPVQLPKFINDFLQNLGSLTTPLSTILIGSLLGDFSYKQMVSILKNIKLWIVVGIKLLIIPLFTIPFAFLHMNFLPLAIAVVLSAMPSAPTTSLFARKYGKDASFASAGVSLTTLISLLTLPIIYGFFLSIIK